MKIKNGMELMVGCDPEFFLRENGVPRSAHFLLDEFGGKHNPLKLDQGAVQVDGTAVEFNTDPAKTADEFVERVDKVLLQIRERVASNYDFNFHPTQSYTQEYFDDEIPPDAKELGCEPDYDAYTLLPNAKPDVARPMRTGGGHIHLSWGTTLNPSSRQDMLDCAVLVRQLDAVLFPASLIWDSDVLRREMYGKPGAFRVKPYGVEYRPLSNAWLRSKSIQKWIFNTAIKSFELLVDGRSMTTENWRQVVNQSPYAIYQYMDKLHREYGIEPLPRGSYVL